ncbi:hypothetical protein NVP1210O_64 [Vibrio phage 1.210.O._10N.222.52.C2]|nr:hypothetical protein NVP1210O_64 [Vibrio phage 1.210.O._10N.222.52.C2]
MKLSNETLTLITRMQNLCIEISQTTEHDAFFDYAGHVNAISVSLNIGGFSLGNDILERLMWLGQVSDESQDEFKKCISALEGYLK